MATSEQVVIGMDPHKRSVTIEVMTADEKVLGGGRFGTDTNGFTAMVDYVAQWPERVWAIEGCNGIGRHIAMRLLAEDQDVLDVPPKLSARARVFSTGQGRKTDATDAHSVALVGTRMSGLRPVVADDQLTVLRMLVDRRRALGDEHTRKVSQLHALLLELLPGGAKKDLSAAQAKALLAKVRPRDLVGRPDAGSPPSWSPTRAELRPQEGRRQGAQDPACSDRHRPARPARHRAIRCGAAAGRGRRHHPLPRPQPLRLLDRNRTVTPHRRPRPHRLSRGGNRQINRVLHTMAVVQLRNATEGRAYFDRKKASGKSSNEAMRCLKRRRSDAVFRVMIDDLAATAKTGPGGQPGNDSVSSATGSQPNTGSSDEPLPGPATPKPRTPLPAAS